MPTTAQRLKPLLITLAVLLGVSAVGWLAAGPVFLARTVDFTIDAKKAGPKWSLEWQDDSGKTINGVWIEASPDQSGTLHMDVHQALPNYTFGRLALRWWAAPGLELTDPGPPRVTERVLWFKFEPTLERAQANIEGTTLGHDSFTSTKPDGGAVWLMPRWTVAPALDLAFVCSIVFLAGLAVFGVLALGRPGLKYNPEAAAIIAVVLVHAYLAIRAPMLFCLDSMDYAVNALAFNEKPAAILHLHPWRMPGYSIFLMPFLRFVTHYSALLGWAQALLAVLSAWMASRITLVFLSRPWAALTILLVGLDPVLLVWTRHAMPELLCTFLVTLIALILVQQRVWRDVPAYWAALAAVGLGILIGALCYVRGNYQILVVFAPLAVAAWPLAQKNPRRAFLLGLLLFATAAACLAPAIVYNYRENKRAEFMVGTGYTQALSLLEARALDRNQAGAFSFDQWQDARTPPNDSPGSLEFLAKLRAQKEGPLSEQTSDLPQWTSQDRRGAAVARESMARHPMERLEHSGRAMARLVGLWDPAAGSENDFWSIPLRRAQGENLTQPQPPANYRDLTQSKVEDIYDRTAVSTLPWVKSGEAAAFDGVFRGAAAVKPLWAALFLLGVLVALARREWCLLLLGVVPLAHAAALSFVLLDGIDRYQAPLYPLMSVVACYGLAAVAGSIRGSRDAGSRTPVDQ
jgi:hypothetical protein